MRLRRPAIILCTSLISLAAQQAPAVNHRLPPELAAYRNWVALVSEPRLVPLEFWFRCAPTTAADWAEARTKYGPHTQRYIRVYGNQKAADTVARPKPGPLPTGSMIAKEKLVTMEGSPEGLGFMIRRATPEFAATDGWEFLYFPASGDRDKTHQECASCHRRAPSGNYVFGLYAHKQR
jgi:hypothetical protein